MSAVTMSAEELAKMNVVEEITIPIIQGELDLQSNVAIKQESKQELKVWHCIAGYGVSTEFLKLIISFLFSVPKLRSVQKTPMYFYYFQFKKTSLSGKYQKKTKKYQKPKSCRQLPLHLIHLVFQIFHMENQNNQL